MFQVYILDCGETKASAQLVRAREPGIEYYVEHCHDLFYILTNYPDGGNYQVSNFVVIRVSCSFGNVKEFKCDPGQYKSTMKCYKLLNANEARDSNHITHSG
jgi:hypothetical protein